MTLMDLRDRLAEICARHILSEDIEAVIPEPYIPYLPEPWNNALVVAEAQNLSKGSKSYRPQLEAMDREARIRRLGLNGEVGVWPWDDGSLKLAVETALDLRADKCGVSNAVLWSQTDEQGRNRNPSEALVECSSLLWSEMLPVMMVKHIVTAGKIADTVITLALRRCGVQPKRTILRLPSPQALSRISGMFDEADLRCRYPEVHAAAEAHPDWVSKQCRNKIFFACHAVSLAS